MRKSKDVVQYPQTSKKWALLLPLVLKGQGVEAVTETTHKEEESYAMGELSPEQNGAMPTYILTLQESQSQWN